VYKERKKQIKDTLINDLECLLSDRPWDTKDSDNIYSMIDLIEELANG